MNDEKTSTAEPVAAVVAKRFALPTPIATVEPYGGGLINDTFLVTVAGSPYILQRINESVFPEPERIMSNLAALEDHLARRADGKTRIPTLIAARDGRPFVRGEDGGVWRLMEFIPNTSGLARIDEPEQAREVGRILGRFHACTSDLNPDRLAVTLPGFHVTPAYLERFARVIDGRAASYPDEIRQGIAFVTARQDGAAVLEVPRRQGRIPMRVIHGDPKLDNILFDRATGRGVSLIDLDTVQPGLVHYDVGDCLRSCCNRGGESAGAHEPTRFDLDLCRAILGAYAAETRRVLGAAEIGLLFDAIRLIPFELGLRFLTDHLEGDRYFRVTEPGQNLRKARIQFALVEDIERKERKIRRIVAECFGQPKNHESKTASSRDSSPGILDRAIHYEKHEATRGKPKT
jgi:Ser/Thr protein kinase RdoA (MazF antagonist)